MDVSGSCEYVTVFVLRIRIHVMRRITRNEQIIFSNLVSKSHGRLDGLENPVTRSSATTSSPLVLRTQTFNRNAGSSSRETTEKQHDIYWLHFIVPCMRRQENESEAQQNFVLSGVMLLLALNDRENYN